MGTKISFNGTVHNLPGTVTAPIATTTNTGVVIIDGETIAVDENGLISVAGGGASSADKVSYDHTSSGLAAENVQTAIDELNTKFNNLTNAEEVSF